MSADERANLNIEHQNLICLLVGGGHPDDLPVLWKRLEEVQTKLGIKPYKSTRTESEGQASSPPPVGPVGKPARKEQR